MADDKKKDEKPRSEREVRKDAEAGGVGAMKRAAPSREAAAVQSPPEASSREVAAAREKAKEEAPISTDPTYTAEMAKEAKKAQDASRKADAEAQDKAGKINANLAKDGATRRIMANTKGGEAKYFWANMVPTQALTDEELKAVGAMK